MTSIHSAVTRVALDRARETGHDRASSGALPVVGICLAVHLVAASAAYSVSVAALYELLQQSPRMLVLEHGLVRLLVATIFLPPLVPTLLVVAAFLRTWTLRHDRDVARWLALALVPLAADSVLRAIGVAIAPTPATIGELLELSIRMSLGPRTLVELLAGDAISASIQYWLAVLTPALAISAYCVVRALVHAEHAAFPIASRRRARSRADTITKLQCALAVAGAAIALTAAGRIVLPFATQLLLQLGR